MDTAPKSDSGAASTNLTASWGASCGAGAGRWALLVHGGAGDVPRASLPAQIAGCRAAAAAAADVLRQGGSALDAAQRAVETLEDDPKFNAGTGGCLNADGDLELDAALMDGRLLRAGAVAALPPFKNPIAIARAALEDARHVLYTGAGAARFAEAHGFVASANGAMVTDAARERLAKVRVEGGTGGWAGGTVGAVVRDAHGTVAAATSTGGLVNKHVGRVGDSPILGAGTYADNDAGACSNTGNGEAVMRLCLAKTVIEWMRGGLAAEEAARGAIHLLGGRLHAFGGLILVDREGRLGLARNTRTMTWAAACDSWSEIAGGA